jgi:hypothetical protein
VADGSSIVVGSHFGALSVPGFPPMLPDGEWASFMVDLDL